VDVGGSATDDVGVMSDQIAVAPPDCIVEAKPGARPRWRRSSKPSLDVPM
jgi:hypothetical protein